MSPRSVLAVDFGTTRTYFSKCPEDELLPTGVDFGDGHNGLATAILYRIQFGAGKPPLIGQAALDEFGEATPAQRRGYSLRAQFKPEIAHSGEASRSAVDFLSGALELAQAERLDVDPTKRHVVFGVPAQARDDYRSALARAAKQAGYGEITMVEEPVGALRYHLHHKDLRVTDAQRGLLVVDFGGGTCDFAFLRRGRVQHSWGDNQLGGRLFDDLFFQWLLDENPGVLELLERDGTEYFVHSYLCRQIKEHFSRCMNRTTSEPVSKAIAQYGSIGNMTWEAFIARARDYTPSETLTRFVTVMGGTPSNSVSQSTSSVVSRSA